MVTARGEGGLLHRGWKVSIDYHFTHSASLRRTPSLTADGFRLQLVCADSKMSSSSLPPDLTAWIYLPVLPRWRRQTYHSLALRKSGISQYAGTFLDMRRATESRSFAWLSITPDDLPAFEKFVTKSPSRTAMLRHLFFTPALPAYSDNACTRFERRADRRRNDEACSSSIERLFTALKPPR